MINSCEDFKEWIFKVIFLLFFFSYV
jgi:hypothetical protein